MRSEYGDEVQVRAVDLSDFDKREQFIETAKAIEASNWPYPVVSIDGTSTLIRGLNFETIANHIDKMREEAAQANTQGAKV